MAAPASLTVQEARIELAIDGLRSAMDGRLLALANGQNRAEKLLERIADALDLQNKLLETRTNGHDTAATGDTDHG